MATLGELSVLIAADFDAAGFNKAEDSIGKFADSAKSAAVGVAASLGAGLALLGSEAIKAAGDIQALEKGFAATYNGALPLADALAKVKELSKLPGLGMKEAIAGATNLQAAGFSADLATRALGAFGNALATVGKGKADLDGVTLALGQIASKGKISAEEINQLAERVPQIRTAIKDAFGTADTTALQKANISATAFVEGVTEQLEKLKRVSGGLKNSIENFGDAYDTALGKLGIALNNAFDVEGIINRFSDLLAKVGDTFADLEPAFKATADYIQDRWNELAQYFSTGEGGRVMSDLADSIVRAGAAISAVFDKLSANGVGSLGELLAAAKPLQNLVRELADGFTGLLDTVSGTLNFITDLLNGRFSKALADIGVVADGLTRPLRSLFGLVEARGATIAEFFGVDLTKSLEDASVAGALLGGNLEGSIEAVAALTDAQRDALAKLRAELINNANASRALGDLYDYSGNKAKILEGGIKSLTDVGFAPAGRVVQQYLAQLKAIPPAYDQMAARMVKGSENLFKIPEFKVENPELDLKLKGKNQFIESPKVLPLNLTDFDLSAEGLGAIYDKVNARMTQAQIDSLNKTRDYNTNIEQAFENLGASIGPGLATLAELAGQAFGAIVTGAASFSDVIQGLFGGIIQALGEFMSTFGKQLIVIGIGKLSLDTLFSGPQGGPLAIAAGAGLIALAGVVSAVGKSASASLKSIGSGGGSLSSQPSGNYNSSAASGKTQQQTVEVVFKLRGQELVGVLRTQDYRSLRTS